MKFTRTLLFVSFALVSSTVLAQEQFENLSRFGLQDVAEVANCVAKQVPSSLSTDFVQTYWGPPILQGSSCVSPGSVVAASTQALVRPVFLKAISYCAKRSINNDGDPWVRRVAYGTATIAAKGVQNWSSGKTLLQQYVTATVACQPKG